MSNSYLIMWPMSRIEDLNKHQEIGQPLVVFFGSPHASAPSLKKYGVTSGDRVFIVFVQKGVIYLLCRFTVGRLMTELDYARDYLNVSAEDLTLHTWTLWEKLAKEQPNLGQRQPWGCVDEATIPLASSLTKLDQVIPVEVLERLQFVTKRGEIRSLPLVNGQFKKINALHGHFHRLHENSVGLLDAIIDNELTLRTP